MKRLLLTLAWLAAAVPAVAQTPTRPIVIEADATVGASSEPTDAAAAQIRAFGPIKADWRVYVEATWAKVSEAHTDAFGAAYPYDRGLRPMEAYVEKMFRPRGALLGVKAGRYRTPFGISSRSDHAYLGFLRAPLIRYGGNWALSPVMLETGADVLVGVPSLYVEASLGMPQDEASKDEQRARGTDVVVRAQGYFKGLVVGASHLRTQPSMHGEFVFGRMTFSGVDARWMRNGILVRGEWMAGQPFDFVRTRGGYVDLIVHRVGMGPVTATARIDWLDYDAGPYSEVT